MKIEQFTYFYPEKPFLITREQPLFQNCNQSNDWMAEKKYNGGRLLLHYVDGQFQFWNRHSAKFNFQPNEELQKALSNLKLNRYCLFDGELRNNKVIGVKQKVILFDIIIWEGELLRIPFSQRRKLLESLQLPIEGEPLGIVKQHKVDFNQLFEEVIKDEEIEGLVLKNLNGKLKVDRKSGQDSSWMLKIRRPSKNYKF
jgi:ATP-dependent DNA ligase